jgi:hypothetical protein
MRKSCSRTPSDDPGPSPFQIDWNRVYQKTKADLKRLREYGLPADTAVFRIVQGKREKAVLYGDFDRLDHKEQGDLIDLVRQVIEGRPPKEYAPTRPILTSPSQFFLRTRGKLKRIDRQEWKGPLTSEEIGNRMTVIDANAQPSQHVVELIADLLLDMVERGQARGKQG